MHKKCKYELTMDAIPYPLGIKNAKRVDIKINQSINQFSLNASLNRLEKTREIFYVYSKGLFCNLRF